MTNPHQLSYSFKLDQTMFPFGLSSFSSSEEAQRAGVTYVRTEGTPASLVAVQRYEKVVKTVDLAFTPIHRSQPKQIDVHEDQLKFYFKGVTSKQISDAPSIDMQAPRKKKGKQKRLPTLAPPISVGKPTTLFDEE